MSYNDGSYLFPKRNNRLRNSQKNEIIQDNCKVNVLGNAAATTSKVYYEDCSSEDSAFYDEKRFKKAIHLECNSQAELSEIIINGCRS